MYESPVNVIYEEMQTQIEGDIYNAIQNVGIDVDKEELLKTLQYDRGQYDKGYSDGYAKAVEEFVKRLKTEHEGLITNLGKPYAITFEKIDKIAEEMRGKE